ncbi:hypothetical protein FRC09_016139 [Ceratobasidium sp. 395]|nr:hypothetical protein FRC09_016139 [Ceratobasidium sp. 395]
MSGLRKQPLRKAGAPRLAKEYIKTMPTLANRIGVSPPTNKPPKASQPVPPESAQTKKRKADAQLRDNASQPKPLPNKRQKTTNILDQPYRNMKTKKDQVEWLLHAIERRGDSIDYRNIPKSHNPEYLLNIWNNRPNSKSTLDAELIVKTGRTKTLQAGNKLVEPGSRATSLRLLYPPTPRKASPKATTHIHTPPHPAKPIQADTKPSSSGTKRRTPLKKPLLRIPESDDSDLEMAKSPHDNSAEAFKRGSTSHRTRYPDEPEIYPGWFSNGDDGDAATEHGVELVNENNDREAGSDDENDADNEDNEDRGDYDDNDNDEDGNSDDNDNDNIDRTLLNVQSPFRPRSKSGSRARRQDAQLHLFGEAIPLVNWVVFFIRLRVIIIFAYPEFAPADHRCSRPTEGLPGYFTLLDQWIGELWANVNQILRSDRPPLPIEDRHVRYISTKPTELRNAIKKICLSKISPTYGVKRGRPNSVKKIRRLIQSDGFLSPNFVKDRMLFKIDIIGDTVQEAFFRGASSIGNQYRKPFWHNAFCVMAFVATIVRHVLDSFQFKDGRADKLDGRQDVEAYRYYRKMLIKISDKHPMRLMNHWAHIMVDCLEPLGSTITLPEPEIVTESDSDEDEEALATARMLVNGTDGSNGEETDNDSAAED